MSLLKEIQASLMESGQDIGSILLKLRFLASRLGSDVLQEWVKYESDGYPKDVDVPEYRRVGVSYKANFNGPFGSGIKNAPIPPYLIEKHAGDGWTTYNVRESISSIDALLSGSKPSDNFHIEASNLILLLQGKVYEGYACNSVSGTVSRAMFVGIQSAVRTRLLELTIELEKSVPAASEIKIAQQASDIMAREAEAVTHITQQIVHGNLTTISNSGAGASFSLNIEQGDKRNLADALETSGIAKDDAHEIAGIMASEEPESPQEPFGPKAKEWLGKNLPKAVAGTWKIGISTASKVLTEAALKYYGLK